MERLHLLAVIGFVLVEDMDSAGCWVPGAVVLWESARILASEVGAGDPTAHNYSYRNMCNASAFLFIVLLCFL